MERLISIPLEVEMNGIPKIESLRSISLYGLSALEMNFQYDIDPYFAREQAFERMADATLPNGVTPGVSPLFSPSGLIYRYVLHEPGPHAAAAQDDRSLGARAQVSLYSRASPTIRAWAARPCSIRCC